MGAEELRGRRGGGKAEFLSLSHFKAEQELVVLGSEDWYCLNRGASEKITYCPVPGSFSCGGHARAVWTSREEKYCIWSCSVVIVPGSYFFPYQTFPSFEPTHFFLCEKGVYRTEVVMLGK